MALPVSFSWLRVEVISACEKGLQWQRALLVLTEMRLAEVDPNTICCNAAISGCEKNAEVTMAFQLFNVMCASGPRPDVVTFNALISCCEKAGSWLQALSLLEMLPHIKLTPDTITYNAAVSACKKGHQWQWALHLLKMMPKVSLTPDAISLSASISACEKTTHWQRAIDLLLHTSRKLHLKGNIISFNAAIAACENSHRWREAVELYAQAGHDGIPSTWSTFVVTVAACAQGRQWEIALALKENALQLLRKEFNADAALAVFNAMISGCEKARHWTLALQQLEDLRCVSCEVNVITYSALISACEKSASRWAAGLQLWDDLHCDSIRPELISYNAAIRACEEKWRWVLALMEKLEDDPRLSADLVTCNSAISCFAVGHQWQYAVDTMAGMGNRRLTPSLVTLMGLWTACLHGGRPSSILDLHDQRDELRNGDQFDAALATVALRACEVTGQLGRASKLQPGGEKTHRPGPVRTQGRCEK